MAPRRHVQPQPLSWGVDRLMWRRADMCSGIRIAGNRATTRASVGPKICPRSKSRPQWVLAWLTACGKIQLRCWGRSKRAESSPP